MNKKKICKMAGIGAISAAIVAGGAFYGLHQFGSNGNSSKGSSSSVQSIDVQEMSATESGHEVTLHFKWKGSQPHMAYTVEDTNVSTTTPGVPMKDEGNGWYTYTVKNAKEADVVISVPELDYTTSEFSRFEGEYWYDLDAGWYTKAPDNYEEPKTQKAHPTGAPEKEITEDAAAVAANTQITIHYTSDWDNTYMYAWNALPDDIEMDWPGKELEKDADGYFSYTFDATTKVNFLFSGDGEQTDDFSIKQAGEYWYHNGKWETERTGETDTPTTTPVVTKRPTTTAVPSEKSDFRDETIYFLMTTRFYDGDSSNNRYCWNDVEADVANNDPGWRGDFKGLAEKLDYIKALGFSAIWITPVVENASGVDYHGYHAFNFSKVDPRYESSDYTYQDLINDAHKKGIKVIQDIVLNHTGNWGEQELFHMFDKKEDDGSGKSPFMQVATGEGNFADKLQKGVEKAGRGAKTYDDIQNLSIGESEKSGAEYQSRLAALKEDDIDTDNYYHHYKQMNYNSIACQLGQMDGDCVDLNTENPVVYNYLIKAYNQYIDMGVDAFRIDTVKHISRLTFNNTFLPAFMKQGGENFYMFGECCARFWGDFNENVAALSPFFYTWNESASSKQYDWSDTDAAANLAATEAHFEENKSSNRGAYLKSDNAFLKDTNTYHEPDTSKASNLNQIDFGMHWAFNDANKAYNVGLGEDELFNDSTWNVVYVDSHDYAPDNAPEYQRFSGSQDTWAENMCLMWTFRGIPCIYYGSEIEFMKGEFIDPHYNSETKRPYNPSGRAYFGDEIEGSINVSDYGVYNGATGAMAKTLSHPLAQHVQRLNLIRRAVPALRKGQYSAEKNSGGMSFRRRYTSGTDDSYVLVNVSGQTTFTDVINGEYVELITGKKVTVSDGTLSTESVGKGNMRVYVLQNDTARRDGATGKIGEDGTYLK